jgi:hypothetical protein
VIDTSVPKVQHPTTPEPAYVLRGLGLFELHADEILDSYRGGGRFMVPSGTEANGLYEVRVGTRPERNRCECRGWASHKHCSHVIAAERVARRSAVCDGCGERTWRRDLSEVQESLTYFAGDLLCRSCRRDSDADVL